MREIARDEVKRRRRSKPAAVASVPEPRVGDKYYAQERPCRMVELGIKVPGCKGTFTPKGNEVTCSDVCRDKLERYHNKKSAKKNYPKHKDAINARVRTNEEEKRKALQFTCQGPLDPMITGGPRCGDPVPYSKYSKMLYCTQRCAQNAQNETARERRQQRPHPGKEKTCQAPHPTIPGKLCGNKFRVFWRLIGTQKYCTDDCEKRVRALRQKQNPPSGPWLAEGISKTTWYRRKGKPANGPKTCRWWTAVAEGTPIKKHQCPCPKGQFKPKRNWKNAEFCSTQCKSTYRYVMRKK